MNLEMQGDVALRPIKKINVPENAEMVENKVLAWGEVSGHAHVVTGDANCFLIEGKMIVVVGSDGAKLEHMKFASKEKADHGPLTLKANQTYEVLLQNEYNPFAGALERVLD